jgi:pyruvate dehydrogenase E2 component (dihydrolipoamide acetyltransferase)
MVEPVRSAKGETEVQEPTRTQRVLARRSAEARATVPDLEMTVEVDVTSLSVEGVSLDAALVRACALALREHPHANGSYRDGTFELHGRVNAAVAIEVDGAYVLATVFDADQKSLPQVREEIEQLTARAVGGELSPPEVSGSTFAIFNLGRHGIASAVPIINPPHAAALGAGTIRDIPVIRQGAIVPSRAMTLTLACDHRILFAPAAAEFLNRIKSLLESGAL